MRCRTAGSYTAENNPPDLWLIRDVTQSARADCHGNKCIDIPIYFCIHYQYGEKVSGVNHLDAIHPIISRIKKDASDDYQKGAITMDMTPVKDMANTYIEHSMVVNNFVTVIGNQLKSSLCRVFGDSVKYKWTENNNKPVIPDVSINCDIKNRRSTSFLGVPRFIMEVLSDATEPYDRNEKMELYKKVEVAEYWIVDWRQKQVEIYVLSPDENSIDYAEYKLMATVTEQNREDLKLYMFPNARIDFDQLFDGVD